MILAAGRGERMGPLTADLPKPLLSIGPESLIERQIRRTAAAGIDEILINLSYRGEQIRDCVGDGKRWGVNISYSQEPDPPLETAGAVVEALSWFGSEEFLLINADVVTDMDLRALRPMQGLGILVMVPNPPHHPDGDFGIDADGGLTHAAPRFTFAGVSRLHTDLFAGLAKGRRALGPVLDSAIDGRRLFALIHRGLWVDVGTPDRLDLACRLLDANEG